MKQGGLGIDKTMTLFVKAEYLMDDIIHQKISPDVAATLNMNPPFHFVYGFHLKRNVHWISIRKYGTPMVLLSVLLFIRSVLLILLFSVIIFNQIIILYQNTLLQPLE